MSTRRATANQGVLSASLGPNQHNNFDGFKLSVNDPLPTGSFFTGQAASIEQFRSVAHYDEVDDAMSAIDVFESTKLAKAKPNRYAGVSFEEHLKLDSIIKSKAGMRNQKYAEMLKVEKSRRSAY